MTEKPFIRVRSKATRDQFDIHRDSFRDDLYEVVARVPDAWKPRRRKAFVKPARTKSPAAEAEKNAVDSASND